MQILNLYSISSFSQMRINIGSTIRGEAATVIQPVDSRVNDFLCKQKKEGCRVPKDIQLRTEYFVKETIFNGQKTKESKRRTFVPSRKKIRNLILSINNIFFVENRRMAASSINIDAKYSLPGQHIYKQLWETRLSVTTEISVSD